MVFERKNSSSIKTEKAIRAMCEVKLKDRKNMEELMDTLSANAPFDKGNSGS